MMNSFKMLRRRVQKVVFKRTKILKNKYPQYEIGRHTYGNPKIRTWEEGATLKIGNFCSIAEGVIIFLGGEHRVDWATTYPFTALWEEAANIEGHPTTKGNVIIGNDVWLGAESVVMSGVQIGDGAVVGARAVVTGNVEPYSIYAGNPARKVKKRFDNTTIQQLMELKWWNFDDSEIVELLPLMLNNKISDFIIEANRRR